MSNRNSGIVEPLDVQNILRQSGYKPSPVEHISSPKSPSLSAASSRPQSSHGRDIGASAVAVEASTAPPRTNRFSVSFPIVPSNSTSPVRRAKSPVREAPAVVPESLALLTGPSDGNFLTAIAAQERRVLELKEEVVKAEAELDKLKTQWAQHEALKKRNDAKSVTKLQPLQTFSPTTEGEDDTDGSNAWMQQEMERRKTLLNSNKSSNRTVFSGSRHTRTLSLLSPTDRDPGAASMLQRQSMRPRRKESLTQSAQRTQDKDKLQRKLDQLPRAVTSPDLTVDGAETLPVSEDAEGGAERDIILETGKKVATGLRDGLWTFLEDLRQVTVGEEATRIEPPPRKKSSAQNLRPVMKQRSKTSLSQSSRGSSSTSKTSTDTKRRSPTRPKFNKASTATSAVAASLSADPSFLAESSSPVTQRATPVKKPGTAGIRSDKGITTVSPRVSSDNEGWDTWDEISPHGSRASSAVSDSTTHPSTASNASPRTSTDVQKTAESSLSLEAQAMEARRQDPIPWPALSNLGPNALRQTARHLFAELDKTVASSPTKEQKDQNDYVGSEADRNTSAVPAP